MQWLIDLILEAIGIPPVYVDRGDPTVPDWSHLTLTLDNTWRELDVSAIVPANASAILFSVWMVDNLVGKEMGLRKFGNVNEWTGSILFTQVALAQIMHEAIIATSPNGKIEYKAMPNINQILLFVKGWWL